MTWKNAYPYTQICPQFHSTSAQNTWVSKSLLSKILLFVTWKDIGRRDALLLPAAWFPHKGALHPALKGCLRRKTAQGFDFVFKGPCSSRDPTSARPAMTPEDREHWLTKWLARFRKMAAEMPDAGEFVHLVID